MANRIKNVARQVNVRFTDDDLQNLARCQKLLGGISQADALRQLMLMYLGKMPAFPKQAKAKKP